VKPTRRKRSATTGFDTTQEPASAVSATHTTAHMRGAISSDARVIGPGARTTWDTTLPDFDSTAFNKNAINVNASLIQKQRSI
jgi:hypothetical protein